VMLRCRHKGVIEASGVSLTKFTRTLLHIQSILSRSTVFSESAHHQYRDSLRHYISEILSMVDFRPRQTAAAAAGATPTVSVTRRSAGLALVVQSVLVGEAEAIYQ